MMPYEKVRDKNRGIINEVRAEVVLDENVKTRNLMLILYLELVIWSYTTQRNYYNK